jgi:hypothetical protein
MDTSKIDCSHACDVRQSSLQNWRYALKKQASVCLVMAWSEGRDFSDCKCMCGPYVWAGQLARVYLYTAVRNRKGRKKNQNSSYTKTNLSSPATGLATRSRPGVPGRRQRAVSLWQCKRRRASGGKGSVWLKSQVERSRSVLVLLLFGYKVTRTEWLQLGNILLRFGTISLKKINRTEIRTGVHFLQPSSKKMFHVCIWTCGRFVLSLCFVPVSLTIQTTCTCMVWPWALRSRLWVCLVGLWVWKKPVWAVNYEKSWRGLRVVKKLKTVWPKPLKAIKNS